LGFLLEKEKLTDCENLSFQNHFALYACRSRHNIFDGWNVCFQNPLQSDYRGFDFSAFRFIEEMAQGEIRIVTNRRETGDVEEYRFKEHEKRIDNHIPSSDPILFYEIELGDASEFKAKLKIHGVDIEGYKIIRTHAPAVPNAIAALLMHLRDKTGKIPHV
jgi:hypothetical protein